MVDEKLPHRLILEERKKLSLTGVTEVVTFDDVSVVLRTGLGTLLIQGRDLKLKNLTQEGGQVAVDGEITSLAYEEPRVQGSFWSRLLR